MSRSRTVAGDRKVNTSSSGKLVVGASEMRMASSSAAASSSKPKPPQMRLRSARPQARLMRAPNGAWITSCMPPLSSKKRSAITRVRLGTAPSARRPAARKSHSCPAAAGPKAHSSTSQAGSVAWVRTSPTASLSSRLRAGASPSQKGMVGAAPCASATCITPARESVRSTRHEVLPSWKMSPGLDSSEKSSSRVPTTAPEGSSRTVKLATSGIAPPEVIATRRARRVPRRRRLTASRCTSPRRPSPCRADAAVEGGAGQVAVRPGARQAGEQRVLVPGLRRHARDQVLGEQVERPGRQRDAVELAGAHRAQQRRGLAELLDGEREQPPLGRARDAVAGAADALQEGGDGARAGHLHHQVDVADVDAQLERGGRDQRGEPARPSGAARRPGGAPWTGCRGGRRRAPRPGARPGAATRAPRACAC